MLTDYPCLVIVDFLKLIDYTRERKKILVVNSIYRHSSIVKEATVPS